MKAATRDEAQRFEGFADRDARFFRALARKQTRDWFAAHRQEYEQGWVAPMRALLREAREKLDAALPDHPLADPKVFRIHRDVRFSKDKAPYKTHIGGYVAIDGAGQGPAAPIVVYMHVGATELFAAAGHYMMLPEQLARFRAAVAEEERGGALDAILRPLVRAGYEIGSHEQLARVPRGFDPEHPRADLLRRKGLVVSFPDPPRERLTSRGFLDWVVRSARRSVPLVEWLAATLE